jgi:carboxymethylenebutenolidase
VSTLQLRARDGNELSAYVAKPEGAPRGAIVVVQEIFGVNSHIRRVVEQYAAEGYVAIAPAMFDRFEKDVNLGYDAKGMEQGIALMMRTADATTLADLNAAITAVAHAGRVGMIGYCWGGRSTYLAACHSDIAAGVAYYGGGIPALLRDVPRCPMMFHFGERDSHIPLTDVEKIRAAYPAGQYHLYPAGHGFNCSERADFDAASARLAFDRSIEFFRKHIG